MDSDVWFMLGLSMFSVFSIMFLIITLNAEEWWHKIVYLTIGLLTSVGASLFWMVTQITLGPVFMFFFLFLAFTDLILIIFLSVQSYNLKYPSRNKRYRPEDE